MVLAPGRTELRDLGHDVVAVDLPSGDDSAGFPEYADVVVDAVGARPDLIVVAQSLAGFTAPTASASRPTRWTAATSRSEPP